MHKNKEESAKQNAYSRNAQRRRMKKPNNSSHMGRDTTVEEI
jgi:hypothetical protein